MGESRLLFKVDPGVEIEIENIGGDLLVEGYDGEEFLAVGEGPFSNSQEDENQVSFSSGGDCRLRIPQAATLKIENVGGSCRIVGVNTDIEIDSVGGDADVRSVMGLRIDSVAGDFVARQIEGDVHVDSVNGDADIRDIEGDVHIDNINGDLAIRDIEGEVHIDNISSDADIRDVADEVHIDSVGSDVLLRAIGGDILFDSIGGDLIVIADFDNRPTYSFESVGGDAVFKVGSNADVRFTLPSDCKRIIKVRNALLETDDDEQTIVLAEGTATVTIDEVGGTIMLTRQDDHDVADIIDDIMPDENSVEDIQRKAEDARRQWERQRERAQEDAVRHAERAQRQAERATERVNERIRRDAERIKRSVERAVNKVERGGFNFEFDFDWPGGTGKHKHKGQKIKIPVAPVPPVPPVPPIPPVPPRAPTGYSKPVVQPVTDEERMLILKMVEAKQISVEDAERLFAALEGRDAKDKG
jgi:hypothetical protein